MSPLVPTRWWAAIGVPAIGNGIGLAIYVGGASTFAPESARSCIDGNTAGLTHAGMEALASEKIWWGDASGPAGEGRAGTGDPISVTGRLGGRDAVRDRRLPSGAGAAGALLGLVAWHRTRARIYARRRALNAPGSSG